LWQSILFERAARVSECPGAPGKIPANRLQPFLRIFRDLQESSGMCSNLQGYAGMFRNLQLPAPRVPIVKIEVTAPKTRAGPFLDRN
jgi:hypothetical protein